MSVYNIISCEEDDDVPSVGVQIINMRKSLEINVDSTYLFIIKAYPKDAKDPLIWTSENNQIVEIKNDTIFNKNSILDTVILRSQSQEGTVNIIVGSSVNANVKDTCVVTVVPRNIIIVTDVKFETTGITMTVGDSLFVTAYVLPENATNKTLTYSSEDESIAAFSADTNKLKAKKEGVITITAKSKNDMEATCKVTVLPKK